MMTTPLDRRNFLGGSAAALGYFFTAGAVSAARAANNANALLQIACIGVGGKGDGDSAQAGKTCEVVAICDIDDKQLDKKAVQFPQAKQYFDFRKMLDEMGKQIDAVTVSTPDHTHACAAVRAIRMKKHVYVQNPLAHNVFEARVLRETAKKNGVCSQMGNQGSAESGLRRGVEIVQEGLIGPVKEVHVWTNRPGSYWQQAPKVMDRPKAEFQVPKTVHWDEFLGPAPKRPYAPGYHPFAWRGWWDFGTGALGDMACHTANLAFRALKLGHPTSVTAEAGDVNPETFPSWAHVVFEFPAREGMPALTLHWYEGQRNGKKVQPPDDLLNKVPKKKSEKDEKDEKRAARGSLLVGEKGLLFSPNDFGANIRLIGENFEGVNTMRPEKLPTVFGGDKAQMTEWFDAIREGKPEIAYSNFDFAGLMTEAILLGNVAIRAAKKIEWDGPNLKCTNSKEAQELIMGTYRAGWEVTRDA